MRLLVIAVLGVVAMPIHASADSKSEAKAHVDRATELHKAGKFAQALDELKTAYALDPRPNLLFAMGQLHVSLGLCPQAITYYERYLSTKPDAETANIAREAIDACKTNPPAVETPAPSEPSAPPAPAAAASPPPQPKPVPAAPVPQSMRPWYSDYVGDGLVAAGLVSGVVGIVFYRSAMSTRDRADAATSYDAYGDLIDQAHSKRTISIVLAGAGAALVAGGAFHFLLSERAPDVQVVPARGGGAVTWTSRF